MDPPESFEDEGATLRATAMPSPQRLWKLRLVGNGQERSVSLDRARTVGSAPGVDVVVAGPTVSRIHARIEARGGTPWIVDLESTNGTFVDGVRVSGAELRDGTRVRLGAVELVVSNGERAAIELYGSDSYHGLVGGSPRMRELYSLLDKVRASDATVLIEGETGTGKDVVARALHAASPRAKMPFVVFDCSAVPESLFESELFGHARGAFSGAERAREGAAEAAAAGTLFLDEVGELPLVAQPKLLRLLEAREIRRLGEVQTRPFGARVVAATHRDLARMVSRGEFREDLYFRLAVLPVTVPPLRERRPDIPALLAHFLKGQTPPADMSLEAERLPWPGNVRELKTFAERAATLGTETARRLSARGQPSTPESGAPDLDRSLREQRDEWADRCERAYLDGWALRTRWNVSAMAEGMGLDRSYVHRLLRKHGLSR